MADQDDRLVWLAFRDDFVLKHQKLECFYCLQPLLSDVPEPHWVKRPKDRIYKRKNVPRKQMATVDHVVPLSKGGGRFDLANLVICCASCNTSKANLLLSEWTPSNPVALRRVKEMLATQTEAKDAS